MKVLIAADIFPPAAGGPATYSVNLANELVKDDMLAGVVSLTLNSDPSKIAGKLWSVTSSNKIFRYAEYFWLLFKHSRTADLIYAMGPVNAGLLSLVAAKLNRKKFVVKVVGDYAWEQGYARFGVRDMMDEFQKKKYNYGPTVWFLKIIESFVVGHADRVIVPSKYLKNIVVGWGVAEKNVEVIYNEVDFFATNPIAHHGEKWLVSVGRLMPWKGMDTLIDVISDISKQTPDSKWKLKIIGDGPEMKNLQKKVIDANLADLVQLTGNLPKEKTLSYIASADVFILNSAYEGFSHVLVEAHNQGVPVLASKAGGNPEVVSGDFLFNYNNKEEIMEKVLAKSLLGKEKNIPHTFGGFKVMIEHTKKILEKLCVN
ncbi:MAG: glycosyltransferase family 4 protein [bacterium]|nr:glycosyltransferase family 4 protein [bacterium]